jgi:uncharacterized RDD family membrane protein YckC
MINEQLIDFIKLQLKAGVSREIITKELLANEWTVQDIEEGFNAINVPVPNVSGQDLSSVYVSNQVDQAQVQIRYAGFWIRLFAYFIDGLILSIPTIIISYFAIKLVGISEEITIISIRPIVYIITVSNILISWIYSIFMVYKYQATLGKKALGIKVLSEGSDHNLTLGKIILRETLGKFISGIILQIGYIIIGFTEKKQGIHDMLAKTVVIYKDPNKKISKWIIFSIIFVIIGIPFMGGLVSSIMLSSLTNNINVFNEKSKIMEQNSLPNPYINDEYNFTFSYPQDVTVLMGEEKDYNLFKLDFFYTVNVNLKNGVIQTTRKFPLGAFSIGKKTYQEYVQIFKESEELNNILEERIEKNGLIWNTISVVNEDSSIMMSIVTAEKDGLNYTLFLMGIPLTEEKELIGSLNNLIDSTTNTFIDTFDFIEPESNQ